MNDLDMCGAEQHPPQEPHVLAVQIMQDIAQHRLHFNAKGSHSTRAWLLEQQ